MGYSGGDSTSGSTGPLGGYDPVSGIADYALYQRVDPYLGNFSGESGQVPNYFTTDSLTDQDIENYLNDIENFVFNPGTGEYEPAGKYSYPLSQLAPEYSDNIDTFLLGVKPGMSGDALQRIEANRLNVQQDALKNHMEMVQQITGDPIRRAEEESRNPGDLDTVAEVQAFERQMADAIDAAGRGGTNPFRNPTSGGGGGGTSWQSLKTSSYTAEAGQGVLTNTTGGAFAVNLPANPSAGDEVKVVDAYGIAGTNNVTIGRNNSKIHGADSDFILDINRAAVSLVYVDGTQGWVVTEK